MQCRAQPQAKARAWNRGVFVVLLEPRSIRRSVRKIELHLSETDTTRQASG
ncbi:unnamed protein product [Amoebophrya sp. A120]|nr:unnamed protein product [Amoebophrya sp. A120]|eukprot:GSA120T00013001001.1